MSTNRKGLGPKRNLPLLRDPEFIEVSVEQWTLAAERLAAILIMDDAVPNVKADEGQLGA